MDGGVGMAVAHAIKGVEYLECIKCSKISETQAGVCPSCGYDSDFKRVPKALIENSAKLRDMLEAVRLGGSMSGWDNEMLDSIDQLLAEARGES